MDLGQNFTTIQFTRVCLTVSIKKSVHNIDLEEQYDQDQSKGQQQILKKKGQKDVASVRLSEET